jgi:hypothetical protein
MATARQTVATTKTGKKTGKRANVHRDPPDVKKREVKLKKIGLDIPKLNFRTVQFGIIGTAPYCQQRMSAKVQEELIAIQEAGETARGRKKRTPKDFHRLYVDAMYQAKDGSRGIPAGAFRKAMIAACAAGGVDLFKTTAKISLFVLADCTDKTDATQLVRIGAETQPYMVRHPVRNSGGGAVDIRARAMWDAGWTANVLVEYDANLLTADDIGNLLTRAGKQVGVGEGRPASKKSDGMGWGTFQLQSA